MRVGIIGCGSIARFRHAPEYTANPDIEEIVFYDRHIERSTALAFEFGGQVVENLEEMLEDPTIKAISDCSSNESHHIFSTQALQAGKHVLCEKPIALTVADAEMMLEAEASSGKKLMIGHNQRFTPAHQKAKKMIENQDLGRVLTFKTTFGHGGPEDWGVTKSKATWFFKKERSGVGVAGDLGIHKIDLLHYLLDDEITEVSAFDGALHKTDEAGQPIQVCDNLVGILKTKKGLLGSCDFSWTYYGEEDNSTIIYCEKGIIKIYHDEDYQIQVLTADGELALYQLEKMQTNDKQTNTGVIDAFIESIKHDEPPPVTGAEALLSLKVILAMLQSQEEGRHISVT